MKERNRSCSGEPLPRAEDTTEEKKEEESRRKILDDGRGERGCAAADAIEREARLTRWNEKKREEERKEEDRRGERERDSLARQSVPTAAQHTSTFSRLSFPFFTSSAGPFLFSGPRVLLFQLLSLSLSLLRGTYTRAATHTHTNICHRCPSRSSLPPFTCLLSFSVESRFFTYQPGRISSNLGARVYVYTRVLIIVENDRAERKRVATCKEGARVECRRSLSIASFLPCFSPFHGIAKISPLVSPRERSLLNRERYRDVVGISRRMRGRVKIDESRTDTYRGCDSRN